MFGREEDEKWGKMLMCVYNKAEITKESAAAASKQKLLYIFPSG